MKNTIKIVLAMLAVTLITGMGTANTAEAKVKAYETKTIKVTEGKSKTIKTKKKIKKIVVTKGKNCFSVGLVHKDGSVWDNPKAAKGKKKFAVWGTGYGRKYEVKVTYTNKCTQKFKIKTVLPSYAQKIVNELKPLLADPDKGLKNLLIQKKGIDASKYEWQVRCFDTKDDMVAYQTMEKYTVSEKKAFIMEIYFKMHMIYDSKYKGSVQGNGRLPSNTQLKKIYKGTFRGVCGDGGQAAAYIVKLLGFKAAYVSCSEINHGWCCMRVTDKSGKTYWKGIYATAHAYNLKSSIKTDAYVPYRWCTLKKGQLAKYKWSPYSQSRIIMRKKSAEKNKIPTKTPDTKQTPVPTSTPSAPTITESVVNSDGQILVVPSTGYTCPGCSPLNPPPVKHTSNTNPYITNIKAIYKDYVVYKHVIGTEVRWFDADGNEYIDINNNGDIIDELIKLAR